MEKMESMKLTRKLVKYYMKDEKRHYKFFKALLKKK